MAGEFKQCANGHYYQGASCPFCKPDTNAGTKTQTPTLHFSGGQAPTGTQGGANTTVIESGQTAVSGAANTNATKRPAAPPSNRTVFGTDTVHEEPVQAQQQPQSQPFVKPQSSSGIRTTPKLVGWLVTYSFDPMGVDYKLYESRNVIGRDIECNITVNDGMMSAKHATLLFRGGQYVIKDEMSAHGTFVNGENIGFDAYILKDGDIIRMGRTEFMIRFSLFAKGEQTYTQPQPNNIPETPPHPSTPPEWKRCVNNHHYQGDACPHCAGGTGKTTIDGDKETKVY